MFPDPTRQSVPLYALHADPLFRQRLRGLGAQYRITFVAGWSELFELVRRGEPGALVVVDPYLDPSHPGELAAQLRTLHMEFPSSVLIAAVHVDPGRVRDLRTLGEWGVAEIVSLDLDTTSFKISRRIDAARERSAVYTVMEMLPPTLLPRTRTLIEAALAALAYGGGPGMLARSLFISVRTLQRRAARAGLPAPRRLLGWMRLLVAARYLDDPGRTVLSAALAAGYSSDSSLHRGFRRFGLPSPGVLRRGHALGRALHRFLTVHGLERP